MKRKLSILLGLVCICLALSACEIQTPGGTLNLSFDESKKSEQTKIIDEDGNETVIESINFDSYLDALLGSVAWPQGTSAADFKSFVGSTLNDLNIDLHDMANRDTIEQAIKDVLETQGVDTSNMEIKAEDWIDAVEGDADEEISK